MGTREELKAAVRAGTPVLVWGPPGVGKTATVQAVAGELGLPLEVVIASIREPSDFLGLPVIQDGRVHFAPPAWAKRLAEAGRGILFLDEVSTAPPAVQAALLRVVLDRVVGDLALPEEVTVVAAANPPEQAAGGWDLSAPLANRFTHLEYRLDAADWAANFPTYWGSPPVLPGVPETVWVKARSLVAAFIRHRPQLLLQVPRDEAEAGRAWPSPRSWDHGSRNLAAAWASGAGREVQMGLLCGAVGEGPGLEFFSWCRDLDLPDPEEVLRDPGSFQLPGRGDQAYAVLSAVVAAAAARLTKERWMAAWLVLARAAQQGGKDVAAAAAKVLAQARRPDLPVPEAVKEFIPVLRKAGMLGA